MIFPVHCNSEWVSSYNYPPCLPTQFTTEERAKIFQDTIICFEMFFFSIIFRSVFSWKEFYHHHSSNTSNSIDKLTLVDSIHCDITNNNNTNIVCTCNNNKNLYIRLRDYIYSLRSKQLNIPEIDGLSNCTCPITKNALYSPLISNTIDTNDDTVIQSTTIQSNIFNNVFNFFAPSDIISDVKHVSSLQKIRKITGLQTAINEPPVSSISIELPRNVV